MHRLTLQLVDIAERALSPAINDPSTAVQALDQLHDQLRNLVTRPFPTGLLAEQNGALRVVLRRPSWEIYVHLALDEIRHCGRGWIQVVERMRALLEDLLAVAPRTRRAVLEEQQALLEAEMTDEVRRCCAHRAAGGRNEESVHRPGQDLAASAQVRRLAPLVDELAAPSRDRHDPRDLDMRMSACLDQLHRQARVPQKVLFAP